MKLKTLIKTLVPTAYIITATNENNDYYKSYEVNYLAGFKDNTFFSHSDKRITSPCMLPDSVLNGKVHYIDYNKAVNLIEISVFEKI